MQVADLALQRSKYKHLTDEQWRWFLQQVEGRERTADKLPTFATIEDWWYPVRLSCEQCSSELTARYKAHIIGFSNSPIFQYSNHKCLDLTGGYGVDTFFLSELFEETDYVEQNAELCRIAEHNFALGRKSKVERQKLSIAIHNCTAEEFLLSSPCEEAGWGLIFLDPARRDSHGGKVFRLGDCTPNVVELMPDLVSHLAPNGRIMLKLSPMIDLTQAIKELQTPHGLPSREEIKWDIHVVAVKNEVKEVLLLSHQKSDVSTQTITAIDLDKKEQAFVFTREEEQKSPSGIGQWTLDRGHFLYEPNAAILKGGAYKLVSERFGLQKLDVNTHLYVSDKFVEHFPGRVWKTSPLPSPKERVISQANVIVRNYPLTAEQLKKKLHLRDGGTAYVIGCRVNGKPVLFSAERV
ncbi:MAG: hypothetical protein IKP57_03385 [Paludibacteraceae bacterium]|nr:hypothetical protein [Paludibacteraceae bacterium]